MEQVNTMKYLGIIIDNKFKFSEHIRYAAEKCTKLIHSLSKSAKMFWGLKHGGLKTIYKAAIHTYIYMHDMMTAKWPSMCVNGLRTLSIQQ